MIIITFLRTGIQRWFYNENMAVEIQSQLDYNYPYLSEQQLPVKVSVTEIKRLAAQKAEILSGDEDSIIDLSSYAVAPKARFMKDTSKITNTEKGTLYHLVMEHLPYSELMIVLILKSL